MNIKFTGQIGKIYSIWFSNLILQILTLAIYRPWAKTKMRKYLYGSILIFNDRLEYSGTGKELFRGSIKAIFWLFLLSLMVSISVTVVFGTKSFIDDILSILLIMGLLYYAQYAALKYKFNRTRWRGIKSSLTKKSTAYAKFRFKKTLLNIVTFGFLNGRIDSDIKEYIINNIKTGSLNWSFEGNRKELDKINFVTLILLVPTLGISSLWYKAALKNYTWRSTKIGDISFNASYSGGKIFALYFTNILLLFCTIGLAIPFILYRTVNFAISNIEILSTEENIALFQSQQNINSATGDALESLVDDDSDYDLDWGIW
ncbi:MAG: DUF898 domain-containing protein [Pelagibacterales bacterium]|nr:DUF898 domain-containing protein [Pelagibacterales bacterium]